ncbi:MAG: hypothetical protein Q8N53_01600 [Longimicrobiales bacterium]|nr:hypothetical protein [Longimicrobiales bacterium]
MLGFSAGGVRAFLLTAPALLLLSACGASLATQGRTEQVIGRASYYSIMTEIPEVLGNVGYTVYDKRETSSALYIETSWQERAPFEDEAAVGVEYARTRFIARAQKTTPQIFTLRLQAENQVRGRSDESWHQSVGDWSTSPPTEMYEAYMLDIFTEIKLRVAAGLRVY